jgi:tetratricopeptide (TPR) repeat protein
VEIGRRVIKADPSYAPGHALYSEAIWFLSDANYGSGHISTDRAEKIARVHAEKAIRLAPRLADGYAALGHLLRGRDPAGAARAYEKAISLDPSRAELRHWLSWNLVELGRHEDAVKQIQTAAEMDPLAPVLNARLSAALVAQRRFGDAEGVITRFEDRGGSAAWVALMRSASALSQGDYSEALKHQRRVYQFAPDLLPENLAVLEYQLGFKDAALRRAAPLHPAVSLFIRGDHEGAAQLAKQMGSALWQGDYYGGLLIEAMALARKDVTLAEIYTSDAQLQVCAVWGFSDALSFVRPLRLANRPREAESLLNCVERRVNLHARNPIRVPGYTDSILLSARGRIEALRGNGAAALASIDRAIDYGYRTPRSHGLSAVPELDGLRRSDAYRRVDARVRQIMEREHQEALRLSDDADPKRG